MGQDDAHLSVMWSFESEGIREKPTLYIDWQESGVEMSSSDSPRGSGQGRRSALPTKGACDL
ncbi:hypothetical protein GCM10010924_39520 [Rhizobium wenxiniae]|nr:hypothetical protein GCM10010924_39520 [Rhizobium wenxiniae]